MRLAARCLFAALLVLVASAASAAVTWSSPTVASDYGNVRASKAACSTGTESAPSTGIGTPEQGIDLRAASALSVHLECAGAITAGSLVAYGMNPITGRWNPVARLTLSTSTAQYQAWTDLVVAGPFSRLAFVPLGFGAVACDVYVFAAVSRR